MTRRDLKALGLTLVIMATALVDTTDQGSNVLPITTARRPREIEMSKARAFVPAGATERAAEADETAARQDFRKGERLVAAHVGGWSYLVMTDQNGASVVDVQCEQDGRRSEAPARLFARA